MCRLLRLLFILLSIITFIGCSKDDNNFEKEDVIERPSLPTLLDPEDVCSCMDDDVFIQYCYEYFDTDKNGKLSLSEASNVIHIDVGSVYYGNVKTKEAIDVESLLGLGYFTNLETINCRDCSTLKSIDLRNNLKITEIIDYAFGNCESLTQVWLPETVSSIGSYAFVMCRKLKEITIPENVSCIGNYAFSTCDNMMNINIPYNVSSIGFSAFNKCTGTCYIYCDIPDCAIVYGESVSPFSYNNFTTVVFGNSVNLIGAHSFYECDNLNTVVIADDVELINTQAFANCDNLSKVFIGGGEIGPSAFSYCNNLEVVDLGDSVTQIQNGAFNGCNNLRSISIGENVTCIDDEAFLNCINLKNIDIGNKVTYIGEIAFANCESVEAVTIPDSVVEFGDGVFAGCTHLQSLYGKYASKDNRCLVVNGELKAFAPSGLSAYVVPSDVVSISSRSFYMCDKLLNITIPNSVVYIGPYVFYGCNNLTQVYCKPIIPPQVDYMFMEGISDCNIYVPEQSVDVYRNANIWSLFATKIFGYNFN